MSDQPETPPTTDTQGDVTSRSAVGEIPEGMEPVQFLVPKNLSIEFQLMHVGAIIAEAAAKSDKEAAKRVRAYINSRFDELL